MAPGSAPDDGLPDGGAALFETLAAEAAAGLAACGPDGTVVYANDACATLFGTDREALVGTAVTETPLVDAADGAAWVADLDDETTREVVLDRGDPATDGGKSDGLAVEWKREGEVNGSPGGPDGDSAGGSDGETDSEVRASNGETDPETRVSVGRESVSPTVEVTAKPATVGDDSYAVVTCRDVTDRIAFERESNILDAIFESIPVYLYVKDEQARHVRVSAVNEDAQDYVGKTDLDIWGGDGRESYEDDMRVIEEGEKILDEEEYNPEWNHFFLTSKVPWRDETGEIRGLIGLTRDLSEYKRHEKQLERQNERLRTVASVISHDIRNPLQVAKGRIDMASRRHDSENVESAAEALDRMGELLEDLLGLVRSGQWVEDPEEVSLQSLAEGCWDTATGEAGSLEFEMDLNLAADPGRLQQLLENLFRNAVVHGGEDVTVRLGPLDDWSGFYVVDDGPGIPEDEREDVFESGYTTAEEGTGFGLAIVEVIAEAHGWHVDLTESDEGGARFEFRGVEFE